MTRGSPESGGSLSERAYLALHDRIVTCDLAPGTTVTERDLVASTGFGLTPVRRALARLDRDGLIATMPRTGYRVTPLDQDAVSEMLEAWDLIGPELVRRGLDRVAGTDRVRLEHLLGRWFPPADDGGDDGRLARARAFSAVSMQIFQLLAGASGNRWLRSAFDQLSDQMARLWITLLAQPSSREPLRALMQDWNDHIAGHGVDEVREHLPRLIVESGRTARTLYAERDPGDAPA